MRRFSFFRLAIAAIVMAMMFGSTRADALSTLTFVSATADPANTACTRSAPCSSISKAYTATTTGGEIVCLDSGIFFNFSITHSITVNCAGSSGSANDCLVTINTAATDVVVLKGLDFDFNNHTSSSSGGTAPIGLIHFKGAGVLHLENTRISSSKGNFVNGLLFAPTGPAKLIVADSSFTNIGDASTVAGIYIKPGSGVTVDVSIERSRFDGNNFGIIADGSGGGIVRGLVKDSFVTNNVNNGITVSTTSSSVVLTVDNTAVTGNGYGLVAGGGANAGMLVTRSTINSNATGLFTSGGGALYSYRDNRVNGNTTTDGAFTGAVGLQ